MNTSKEEQMQGKRSRKKFGRCSFRGCGKRARYAIGWVDGAGRHWGPVCGEHDRIIGRSNLMRLMGLTAAQAAMMDRAMDRGAHADGG